MCSLCNPTDSNPHELFNLNMQILINFAEKSKGESYNDIVLLRKWMEHLIISIDRKYGTPKDTCIFHLFTDGENESPTIEYTKHLCCHFQRT